MRERMYDGIRKIHFLNRRGHPVQVHIYKCKLHVLIHKSNPQKNCCCIRRDISMTGMHDLYCSVQKLILPILDLHAEIFVSEIFQCYSSKKCQSNAETIEFFEISNLGQILSHQIYN